MAEPTGLYRVFLAQLQVGSAGGTLPMQNGDYLHSRHYHELERPLDSCWLLDGSLHDGQRPIGSFSLSRPRSAKPFRTEDLETLNLLRPWMVHALRDRAPGDEASQGKSAMDDHAAPLPPLRRGTAIFDQQGRVLFQTSGTEHLFFILNGTVDRSWRGQPHRPSIPAEVRRVISALLGTSHEMPTRPPRLTVRTAWGVVTIEATWLVPATDDPSTLATDLSFVPIAVTIDWHEDATTRTARVLREAGASPAQLRIGVLLAKGMSQPAISAELGIKTSSVVDATRKLYNRLNVRNSTELGARIWLQEPE